MWPTALQDVLLAVLLWPVIFTLSNPVNCGDEQSTLSNCLSISEEKLLDRVIQHAELIYRVSEESCSLFVSTFDWQTQWTSEPEHLFFFLFKMTAMTCLYIKIDPKSIQHFKSRWSDKHHSELNEKMCPKKSKVVIKWIIEVFSGAIKFVPLDVCCCS